MALTLTAYAKLRGCSVKSVSRAVADGRLLEGEGGCVGRDAAGRPTILDPDLADRQWKENSRRLAAVEHPPASEDGQPGEPAVRAGSSPAPDTARPAGVPAFNVSRDVRAAAAARRETYLADLAELELHERRKAVIPADAARADVTQAYSLVKTRITSVPAAVGQRLPDLAAVVVPVVDELLRAALEELSGGAPT